MKSASLLFVLFVFIAMAVARDNKTKVDALVYPKVPPKTITVGDETADIPGFTSDAIQVGIDALRANGGGTLRLTAGTFEIMRPVRIYSNMALVGSGPETVLHKVDGRKTNFIIDADYGELKVTVADPSGFVPGMGIQIFDENNDSGWMVSTAVITAVEANTLYFDNYLVSDYRADRNGVVSNACSVVEAVEAENVRFANFSVDGNKEKNDFLNGCRGGAVYLHKVKNALVEDLVVRDFNGEGISWQITEDVTVRNCKVSGCTNYGLHPGTGSPNTVIEGVDSHDNGRDGLFICWRVQHGIVRNSKFHHNGRFGICTGHKDTDMIFENNHIYENGEDGVHFRGERPSNAPHRNFFRYNIVENNGTKNGGYGFSFNSPAKGVVLEDNIIRDTGKGTQKAGVYIYKNALPVILKNNKMSGHKMGDVVFEEKKGR